MLEQAGDSLVAVRTDDPEGCPAFFARSVSGVVNGPAPEWMQALLVKADSGITGLEGLKGKLLAVQTGTTVKAVASEWNSSRLGRMRTG